MEANIIKFVFCFSRQGKNYAVEISVGLVVELLG